MFIESMFTTSQLYGSFVSARGQSTLDAAFLENNADRVALLEPLQGMQGLPPQLTDSIEAVLSLSDERFRWLIAPSISGITCHKRLSLRPAGMQRAQSAPLGNCSRITVRPSRRLSIPCSRGGESYRGC